MNSPSWFAPGRGRGPSRIQRARDFFPLRRLCRFSSRRFLFSPQRPVYERYFMRVGSQRRQLERRTGMHRPGVVGGYSGREGGGAALAQGG